MFKMKEHELAVVGSYIFECRLHVSIVLPAIRSIVYEYLRVPILETVTYQIIVQ